MSPREPFALHRTQVVPITAWTDYEAAIRDAGLHGWAFRGQSSAAWPVESALTRRLLRYGVHPSAWPLQERRILSLFKRKAHLFLQHIPDETDYFQWLGLMQHHGAPTRLIDFTWSPEVAAFFALESATPGTHCAVWAICVPKLWNASFRVGDRELNASALSLRQPANYETHYLPNAFPFVSTDDPLDYCFDPLSCGFQNRYAPHGFATLATSPGGLTPISPSRRCRNTYAQALERRCFSKDTSGGN
jgi:hypothetical protein